MSYCRFSSSNFQCDLHLYAEETLQRLLQLRCIGDQRFPETVIDEITAEAFPGEDNSKWFVELFVGGEFAGAYSFDSLQEAEADLLLREQYQLSGLYYKISARPRYISVEAM